MIFHADSEDADWIAQVFGLTRAFGSCIFWKTPQGWERQFETMRNRLEYCNAIK